MIYNFTAITFWSWCLLIVSNDCFASHPREIGSSLGLEAVADNAGIFCIASFEFEGKLGLGSAGYYDLTQALIKLEHNLLDGDLQTTSCDYVMESTFPLKDAASALPIRGKPYLMIGSLQGRQFSISKAVDPSKENLDIVLKVIRKRGLQLNSEGETDPATQEAKPISTPFLLEQLKKKTPEAKPTPTTPSVESAPPTPWSIIVVLIVAATGVLCLLMKKRK